MLGTGRRRPVKEEFAITQAEVNEVVYKAWNCFSLDLIDAKTANKIKRTRRRVISAFRTGILSASWAELELLRHTVTADIAELREADQMLSGLLASRTKGPRRNH
jgi:hypothetical protein